MLHGHHHRSGAAAHRHDHEHGHGHVHHAPTHDRAFALGVALNLTFVGGEAAAGIVGLADVEGAEARGLHSLGSSRDHLPEYPGTQGGTTRRWAEAHPDVLIRFIRASAAASQWAKNPANRAAAIALYRQSTGANPETAEEAYATLIPDAAIDVQGIQTVLDLRVALGFLPAPAPPAARFYDTRYWEAATGRRHP
jgi:ABC-type nitrate/sulfonate/bicarbonate transport system substrate-binding protein